MSATFNIVTASDLEFYAFASELVTADGKMEEKAARLAKNHGFLSSMMKRVYNHFKSFGSKAWRVLKNSRVWYSILMMVVSAIMLVMDARNLRHFKLQPNMGKVWNAGSASIAFVGFCKGFIDVFGQIATAWSGKEPEPSDKERADALVKQLKEAQAKTAAYEQVLRARRKPRHGSVHAAVTEHEAQSDKTEEQSFEYQTPSVDFGSVKVGTGTIKYSSKKTAKALIYLRRSNTACEKGEDPKEFAKQLVRDTEVLEILADKWAGYEKKHHLKTVSKVLFIGAAITAAIVLLYKKPALRKTAKDIAEKLQDSKVGKSMLKKAADSIGENIYMFRRQAA